MEQSITLSTAASPLFVDNFPGHNDAYRSRFDRCGGSIRYTAALDTRHSAQGRTLLAGVQSTLFRICDWYLEAQS
jgi:hypothetical protein